MGLSKLYHSKMPTIDKVCVVCGDKALGYNFNAVTCESCKAFFRRNAPLNKEFQCPFNETCEITVITRRFCQRCRLEKCFNAGMKKEYIMSQEDKIMKLKKVEQNRAKRKSKLVVNQINKVKKEHKEHSLSEYWHSHETQLDTNYIDSSPYSLQSNSSTLSFNSVSVKTRSMSPISPSATQCFSQVPSPYPVSLLNNHSTAMNKTVPVNIISSTVNSSLTMQNTQFVFPTKDSNASDIVNFIVEHPRESGQFFNSLMPTPEATMDVLSKIINSQKDAMRLICHLIGTPGDALKIISKIMNSPFDALTVFTKFMGSPNDALEIIAKCVNSPTEVLQFIQQLMCSPKDAEEILNNFLNAPAEAMKMLNDMVNISLVDSTTKSENGDQSFLEEIFLATTEKLHKSNSEGSDNEIVSVMKRNLPGSIFNSLINGHFASNNIIPKKLKEEEEAYKQEALRIISLETIISDAVNMEYAVQSNEIGDKRELNDAESSKLNELVVAYKALFIPIDEDLSSLVTSRSDKMEKNPQDPQLLTLINLTAIAVKRLIKMVKQLSSFNNMCQDDQVALLKGGCTEMMILRSIIQYDVDHSTWKIPHNQEVMSSIKSDVLKLANNNVYEEYENFIRTFDVKLKEDDNIILIMSAIVLFTPNRAKTVHTGVLILEQNSYFYLLRRYLESVYLGCEAKTLYLKTMQKINELQRLKDVIIAVYLDINPNHVEPLLREIFDIKSY